MRGCLSHQGLSIPLGLAAAWGWMGPPSSGVSGVGSRSPFPPRRWAGVLQRAGWAAARPSRGHRHLPERLGVRRGVRVQVRAGWTWLPCWAEGDEAVSSLHLQADGLIRGTRLDLGDCTS